MSDSNEVFKKPVSKNNNLSGSSESTDSNSDSEKREHVHKSVSTPEQRTRISKTETQKQLAVRGLFGAALSKNVTRSKSADSYGRTTVNDVLSNIAKETSNSSSVKNVVHNSLVQKGLATIKNISEKRKKKKEEKLVKKQQEAIHRRSQPIFESSSRDSDSDSSSIEKFSQSSWDDTPKVPRKFSINKSESFSLPTSPKNWLEGKLSMSEPGTPIKENRRNSVNYLRSRSNSEQEHNGSRRNSVEVYDRKNSIDTYVKTFGKTWDEVEADLEEIEDDTPVLDIKTCVKNGFKLEIGDKNAISDRLDLSIEDSDKDIPYYLLYFAGKDHLNYITTDRNTTPVSVSLEPPKDKEEYKRAIVRSKRGNEKHIIPPSHSTSVSAMFKHLKYLYPSLNNMKFTEIYDSNVQSEFIKFENSEIVSKYKFGLLYAKGDQSEDEIFSNVEISPDFEEFMGILGDKIELMGWEHFRGGLDNKNNTTGTHSLYTKFANFEIMYHALPFLPFQADDEQKVERKRHVGNDVVVIIFKENNEIPFDPSILTSHFNKVFAVVQVEKKVEDKVYYKISFANKDGVEPYGPYLPHPAILEKQNLRNFLLTKLINAERSAMLAPQFRDMQERTRKELLINICNNFALNKKTMRRMRAFTDPEESSDNSAEDFSKLSSRISKLFKTKNNSTDDLFALKTYKDKNTVLISALDTMANIDSKDFDQNQFRNLIQQTVQCVTENSNLIAQFDERRYITEAAQAMMVQGSHFMHIQEQRKTNAEVIDGNYEEVKYKFVESVSKLSLAVEIGTRPLNRKIEVETKEKTISEVLKREQQELQKEEQKLREEEIMIIKEETLLYEIERTMTKQLDEILKAVENQLAQEKANEPLTIENEISDENEIPVASDIATLPVDNIIVM